MQRLHRRIEKIEETLMPKNRISLVFVRKGHEDEDCEKQKNEYHSRWGDKHHVTFVVITEYCDFDHDYETFIQKKRSGCAPGNCFTDWW